MWARFYFTSKYNSAGGDTLNKIKLIEIKLNEQGEKCTAVLKAYIEQ